MDSVANNFPAKNALHYRILHIRFRNFPVMVILSDPSCTGQQKRPQCLDPDTNFRLARQRSHCSCFSKRPSGSNRDSLWFYKYFRRRKAAAVLREVYVLIAVGRYGSFVIFSVYLQFPAVAEPQRSAAWTTQVWKCYHVHGRRWLKCTCIQRVQKIKQKKYCRKISQNRHTLNVCLSQRRRTIAHMWLLEKFFNGSMVKNMANQMFRKCFTSWWSYAA